MLCRFLPLYTLLLMAASAWAGQPDGQEFVRVYKKEFSNLTREHELQLVNRNGRVAVYTWDQPRAMVTVRVSVRARSQSEAEKTLSDIQVSFSEKTLVARAETSFLKKVNFGYNDKEVTIDYEVFMPATTKLMVSNKYGSTLVEPLQAQITARDAYGKLHVMGCSKLLDIKAEYSSVVVDKCGSGSIGLAYSNLTLDQSDGSLTVRADYGDVKMRQTRQVILETGYTNVRIEEADYLRFNTDYGNYKINRATRVIAQAEYSDIYLGQIAQEVDVNAEYGSVYVDLLSASFTRVHVQTDYTDVTINMEKQASYNLDAMFTYGDVFMGGQAVKTVGNNSSRSVKTSVGHTPKSTITARMTYGSLHLK